MKAWIVAAILALPIVRVSPARAQFDSTLYGQRARVRVSDLHRQGEFLPKVLELRGNVASVTPDTIVLLLPNIANPLHVARANILNLAVSRGVPSRLESAVRRGLWWGIAGAYIGWVYLRSPERDPGNTWEDAVGTGAAIGVFTGVLFGTISPYERWRRIRIR
jgi:hypothetical protein